MFWNASLKVLMKWKQDDYDVIKEQNLFTKKAAS